MNRVTMAAAILATWAATWATARLGQRHCTTGGIWDLGFATVPWVPYDHATGFAFLALPWVLYYDALLPMMPRIVHAISVLLILRAVTMVTTVMPSSNPACDSGAMRPMDWLFGHCHDQMFSGHTAVAVVTAMALVTSGAAPGAVAALFPVLTGTYMVASRAHYTMDVLVGAALAFFVF